LDCSDESALLKNISTTDLLEYFSDFLDIFEKFCEYYKKAPLFMQLEAKSYKPNYPIVPQTNATSPTMSTLTSSSAHNTKWQTNDLMRNFKPQQSQMLNSYNPMTTNGSNPSHDQMDLVARQIISRTAVQTTRFSAIPENKPLFNDRFSGINDSTSNPHSSVS
jgi:hypothetical protein